MSNHEYPKKQVCLGLVACCLPNIGDTVVPSPGVVFFDIFGDVSYLNQSQLLFVLHQQAQDRMLPQKLVSAAEVAGYNVRAMLFIIDVERSNMCRQFFRADMDCSNATQDAFCRIVAEDQRRPRTYPLLAIDVTP